MWSDRLNYKQRLREGLSETANCLYLFTLKSETAEGRGGGKLAEGSCAAAQLLGREVQACE